MGSARDPTWSPWFEGLLLMGTRHHRVHPGLEEAGKEQPRVRARDENGRLCRHT